MRYYSIKITNDDGSLIRPSWAAQLNLPATYTSAVGTNAGGNTLALQTLPGALRLELDINLRPFFIPRQGSLLRIHGVSLEELGQSYDLSNKNIEVALGMAPGLPLARPRKTYLVMYGRIFQAFGNWQALDQYLELILVPPWGGLEKTQIGFDWAPNTPLAQAVTTSLQTAFPLYKVNVSISDDLRMAAPQQGGPYDDLNEFNKVVYNLSKAIKTADTYEGVSIVVRGKSFLVYDGTKDYGAATQSNPTVVNFEDIIGQPTWIGPNLINFKCVMRADIQVGDYVKLPATLATPYVLSTQASSFPFPNLPSRNNLTFQGTFKVREVHYFGDSRQADANSWVTTYDAVVTSSPATSASGPTAP